MWSEESRFRDSENTGSSTTSGKSYSVAERYFPRIRNESPPTDLYGEYKSDSQLFFTDKLEESKHCSLWLTVILIILTWNTFILSLHTLPPAKYHIFKRNVSCTSKDLKLLQFNIIGNVIGFTTAGFVADICGRRKAILLAIPVYTVAYIIKIFTVECWILGLVTTLAYTSINISTYIGIILLLELVDSEIRSFMVVFVWVGYGIAGALRFFLVFHFNDDLQWVIISTLLLPLCMEWLLPESPHWLLCRKKWKEMLNVLREMNFPKSLEINEDVYRNSEPLPVESVKNIMKTLLKPAFRIKMLLGVFLYCLTYFLYNAERSRIITTLHSADKFLLIEAICIMINIALIPLMLRSISRPMSICTSLLVLAFFYCAATMYQSYSGPGIGISCICLVFAQNAIITNGLLIMETFPTRVRTTAMALCRTAGTIWVSCAVAIKQYTGAVDTMGTYGWTIYAALMLIAAFVCMFVSDTGNVPLPDTELQAIIHF